MRLRYKIPIIVTIILIGIPISFLFVYLPIADYFQERTVYETFMEPTENPNFFLYVSGQSSAISPVDITVFIDGELALKGNFTVGNFHSFHLIPLSLSNGTHTIFAKSLRGEAELEEEFVIDGPLWAVLSYFHSPDGPHNKTFSFSVFTDPIEFQ